MRTLRHLWAALRTARGQFTGLVCAAIEREIATAESRHAGEIRFVVEAALHPWLLWRGLNARARALQLFGALGVWDTAGNNGVLIYVLLADHSVELVADRGIAARIAPSDWQALCREIEAHYRRGEFEAGSVAAVRGVAAQLARHFPAAGGDANELPNQPVLL